MYSNTTVLPKIGSARPYSVIIVQLFFSLQA